MSVKDWVRAQLRRRRIRRHLNRPQERTPFGFLFAGSKPMQTGAFEPAETALVMELLDGADLFVNVGANIGYYVCIAQNLGVASIAVEPVPSNLETLRRNLDINGWSDAVTVLPVACGVSEGTAEIFGEGTGASLVPGWAGNPQALPHVVPVHRLDSLLDGRGVSGKTVFLVDVEGFEFEVLKGAEAILSGPDKPVWLIESGLTDHRAEGGLNARFLDILDFIHQHGYGVYSALDRSRRITRQEVEADLADGVDRLGTHNFLLLPEAVAAGKA